MRNKSDFFGPVFILGLAELKLGLRAHTRAPCSYAAATRG